MRSMAYAMRQTRANSTEDLVPVFYAYTPVEGRNRYFGEEFFWGNILLMFVCLSFGGVHLLAWFSDFPTYTEQLLWRICSVAITVLPLIYGFPVLILRALIHPRSSWGIRRSVSLRLTSVIFHVQFAIPPLYFIARLFLLIEMMISFRNFPSSAFVNVTWTTYFPHV
ncbi:hypothetical protein CPC08DRAFT_90598 [Agrocybe pediades]|nr:hypothetical protein CPC08DRAFT_90598 [Agrocybe pediades]